MNNSNIKVKYHFILIFYLFDFVNARCCAAKLVVLLAYQVKKVALVISVMHVVETEQILDT